MIEIVHAARERTIPIRIGVNAGSIDREILQKTDDLAEAMVESACKHIRLLEDLGYNQVKVSLKASEVAVMLKAYRIFAKRFDYPLHLGVTEAGTPDMGSVKSAIGIGSLLSEGIGDTIRVSLTADPVEEVLLAKKILKVLGLRKDGLNLISCPSCGRTADPNFIQLVSEVELQLKDLELPLTIAVMGCVVNGPGESSRADLGICFGGADENGQIKGVLVREGKIMKTLEKSQLIVALIEEAKSLVKKRIAG